MHPPHRVKRPTKRFVPSFNAFDALTEVNAEVLQLLSAFAIEFNHMEHTLDEMLHLLLQVDTERAPYFGFEVTSRINGMDGKLELIKGRYAASQVLAPEVSTIAPTLTAVAEFKGYRDALIHARVVPSSSVATTFVRRGSTHEVDLSVHTLAILYRHLVALGVEVTALYLLSEHNWSDMELVPEGDHDPEVLRRGPGFIGARTHLLECRETRKSLPEIPEFAETSPSQS